MQQHSLPFGVLKCLHAYLPPLAIARICFASNEHQSVLCAVLQDDFGGFLPHSIETAADASALLWLWNRTGPRDPRIIPMLDVPYDLAEKLVARGFRLTYKQIRQAAEARIGGVEVWIRALRGYIKDCPVPVQVLASALCTPGVPVWPSLVQHLPEVPAEAIPGLLHLAVNANRPEAARWLLCYLDRSTVQVDTDDAGSSDAAATKQQHEQLTPELLSELLLTAASRPVHAKAYVTGIDEDFKYIYSTPAGILPELCAVAERVGLPEEAIAKAITAAARLGYERAVCELCSLPAAASALDADKIVSVLRVLIPHRPQQAVQAVCSLPGASALSAAVVTELLLTAIQQGSDAAFQSLSESLSSRAPAVTLRLAELEQLITEVVAQQKSEMLKLLLQYVPAEQLRRLDCELVAGWMIAALQLQGQTHSNNGPSSSTETNMVGLLCQLQGAGMLEAAAVHGLLEVAIEQQDAVAVQELCSLRGAKQIGACSLRELMKDAMVCGNWGCARGIVGCLTDLLHGVVRQQAA